VTRARAVFVRELRAYFDSPIAYVFLIAFAGAALFTFFNVQSFFARGVADLRGLFDPLPLLLILLVPAITMRLWSEEQKQGTLEVLLTLPVRDHELVLGKFLASWALLAAGWPSPWGSPSRSAWWAGSTGVRCSAATWAPCCSAARTWRPDNSSRP
jgi:ABC-2 type transport system permease protein